MTAATADEPGRASFETLVAPHQSALLAHCYRMTGSLPDAEDALQETLLRAWRAFDSFEGRSSLRTWLFRIANNAALRILEQRRRRVLPADFGPSWDPHEARGGRVEESTWVTPFPGVPTDVSPDGRYERRESVELAFVAALQTLPGRQRAVLLLRDVLAFSAAETAEVLESSLASVNSALNRARRAMEARDANGPRHRGAGALDDARTRALVERFVAAWVDNDVDRLVTLLAEDVEMSMPPVPTWFRGVSDVSEFLRAAPMSGRLQWATCLVEVNGYLGFALWSDAGQGWEPHSINALTFADGRVIGFDAFLTVDLFASFGLSAQPGPIASKRPSVTPTSSVPSPVSAG